MNILINAIKEMSYIAKELLLYDPAGYNIESIRKWVEKSRTLRITSIGHITCTLKRDYSSYTIHFEKEDDDLVEVTIQLFTLQNGESVPGPNSPSIQFRLSLDDLGSMLINLDLQIQRSQITIQESMTITYDEKSFGNLIYDDIEKNLDRSINLYET